MSIGSEIVSVPAWFVKLSYSGKAVKIRNALDKEFWIPLTMINKKEPIPGKPNKYNYYLPEWFAIQKGIISNAKFR